MAYSCGIVGMHAPIKVRKYLEIDGQLQYKTVETTVGRIIFNEPIPQELGYVDRTNPDNAFEYEINFRTDNKKLADIVDRCIAKHGFTKSTEMLDKIKELGFKYSTQGAITVSIFRHDGSGKEGAH